MRPSKSFQRQRQTLGRTSLADCHGPLRTDCSSMPYRRTACPKDDEPPLKVTGQAGGPGLEPVGRGFQGSALSTCSRHPPTLPVSACHCQWPRAARLCMGRPREHSRSPPVASPPRPSPSPSRPPRWSCRSFSRKSSGSCEILVQAELQPASGRQRGPWTRQPQELRVSGPTPELPPNLGNIYRVTQGPTLCQPALGQALLCACLCTLGWVACLPGSVLA